MLRLVPLNGQFAADWYNHAWISGYTGEYLREHHTIPIVLNTTEQVGMPYPIFYGPVFYPVMSLLTISLKPGVALRLVFLVLTWMQFWLVSRALTRTGLSPWISRAIACLVIWATYPLTNLYNRSAITEYVATCLLTCMFASWFLLLNAERQTDRRRIALGIGLLFALTAGTHAITGLYSMAMLGLLLVAAFCEYGRNRERWGSLLKAVALPAVLAAVVLAPWVYALSAFNKYLWVNSAQGMPFYYSSLDLWSARFYPVPHDPRTPHTHWSKLETPFLDAQIAVVLLIFVIGCLALLGWRNRSAALAGFRATALGLAACALFNWLSVSASGFDFLPAIARAVQLAYRLVTYANLALLLAVFMLVGSLRRRGDRSFFQTRPLAVLVIACTALAVAGVVIKLGHASKIMHVEGTAALRAPASERRGWITLPRTFYGDNAYATPLLYAESPDSEQASLREVRIAVGTGAAFGVPQPLTLSVPDEAWIATNVQPFPWNQLEIDGVAVPPNRLRAHPHRLIVQVPPGDHTLTVRTEPDTTWVVLRALSFVTLALWFLSVLCLKFPGWWRHRLERRSEQP